MSSWERDKQLTPACRLWIRENSGRLSSKAPDATAGLDIQVCPQLQSAAMQHNARGSDSPRLIGRRNPAIDRGRARVVTHNLQYRGCAMIGGDVIVKVDGMSGGCLPGLQWFNPGLMGQWTSLISTSNRTPSTRRKSKAVAFRIRATGRRTRGSGPDFSPAAQIGRSL
jgi:hypothetical protein